ncbi:hypothetical protein [Prevotella sp. P6B1]|uniref:hypothetical protein n=1 Tax=Prevotella sp. P6B1 TaxID=1410613 RepID=UPI00051B6174|nr:hypothetical protein [Prevotella sp. P6B1]
MRYIIQKVKGKILFKVKDIPAEGNRVITQKEKSAILEDGYSILFHHPNIKEIVINEELTENV